MNFKRVNQQITQYLTQVKNLRKQLHGRIWGNHSSVDSLMTGGFSQWFKEKSELLFCFELQWVKSLKLRWPTSRRIVVTTGNIPTYSIIHDPRRCEVRVNTPVPWIALFPCERRRPTVANILQYFWPFPRTWGEAGPESNQSFGRRGTLLKFPSSSGCKRCVVVCTPCACEESQGGGKRVARGGGVEHSAVASGHRNRVGDAGCSRSGIPCSVQLLWTAPSSKGSAGNPCNGVWFSPGYV